MAVETIAHGRTIRAQSTGFRSIIAAIAQQKSTVREPKPMKIVGGWITTQ